MFRIMQQRQMDAVFNIWRGAHLPRRPPSGWIRAIRESLGMSAAFLARRLGVVPSTVTRLEASELDSTISLASLRRVAEVLDCELHYALVPRHSLEQTLRHRAESLARQRMANVAHTMALEDQALGDEARERQIHELADSLLKGPRRDLWQ